eukprot:m.113618 g.113618  ORF g.113618 m.113618 type:complete len:129 (+) comp28284_c0_seq1:1662-2048(+)
MSLSVCVSEYIEMCPYMSQCVCVCVLHHTITIINTSTSISPPSSTTTKNHKHHPSYDNLSVTTAITKPFLEVSVISRTNRGIFCFVALFISSSSPCCTLVQQTFTSLFILNTYNQHAHTHVNFTCHWY